MRFDQLVGIERSIREYDAPYDRHHDRGDEKLRQFVDRALAELAVRDPALKYPAQRAEPAGRDVIPVVLNEIGVLRRLRDHQADDHARRRAWQAFHECEQGPTNKGFGTEFRAVQRAGQFVDARRDDAADDRLEQLLLGLEIQVQETLADARPPGDFLDLGRRKALVGECGKCRLRDLLGAVFLAALIARLTHGNALLTGRGASSIRTRRAAARRSASSDPSRCR